MVKNTEDKPLAQNKKARHDYEIYETFEAGIVLTGTEIKSVRQAKIQLKDGFARVRNGEVWLSNVHIAPFDYRKTEQRFLMAYLSKEIFLMLRSCARENYCSIKKKLLRLIKNYQEQELLLFL